MTNFAFAFLHVLCSLFLRPSHVVHGTFSLVFHTPLYILCLLTVCAHLLCHFKYRTLQEAWLINNGVTHCVFFYALLCLSNAGFQSYVHLLVDKLKSHRRSRSLRLLEIQWATMQTLHFLSLYDCWLWKRPASASTSKACVVKNKLSIRSPWSVVACLHCCHLTLLNVSIACTGYISRIVMDCIMLSIDLQQL